MGGLHWIAICLGAYLLGSIPSAYAIGRLFRGIDVRKAGSGNVGFFNSVRTTGFGPGLAVLALDLGKGAAAILLARALAPHAVVSAQSLAALGAVIGHDYMLFLGFDGGKGLAVTIASVSVISPWLGLSLLVAMGVLILVTRDVNTGAGLGVLGLPIWAWLVAPTYLWLAAGLALVVGHKHRRDFQAYWQGRRSLLHKEPKRV